NGGIEMGRVRLPMRRTDKSGQAARPRFLSLRRHDPDQALRVTAAMRNLSPSRTPPGTGSKSRRASFNCQSYGWRCFVLWSALRHGVSFLKRAEIKPVEPDPAHTGEGMSEALALRPNRADILAEFLQGMA